MASSFPFAIRVNAAPAARTQKKCVHSRWGFKSDSSRNLQSLATTSNPGYDVSHSGLLCGKHSQFSNVSTRSTSVNQTVVGRDLFKDLQGKQAYLVSEQKPVDITNLWAADERCVLVFARSMG